MISLASKTLIYEWRRFFPVVMAVCFSGVLLIVQAALVLGIFGTSALYVNTSSADLWAGYPGTQSVNFGRAIDPDTEIRLRMDPDVTQVEPYEWVDGDWSTGSPDAGSVSIYLSGISTQPDAMMFSKILPAHLRQLLREPGAVIVDDADADTLGLSGNSGRAWINKQPVNVVAVLPGLRGLGGVNVLSSLETARQIAGTPEQAGSTYYLARLRAPALTQQVQNRINQAPGSVGPFEVWSAQEFATRSQRYWLFDTGAGMAVVLMALIVSLVGAVITNQSFASVVAGSAREYATLNALGASRRALARVVIEQSCMIGFIGMVLAIVVSGILLAIANFYRVSVAMTPLALLACVALVALMALLSSVTAVRSLLRVDPALLLR